MATDPGDIGFPSSGQPGEARGPFGPGGASADLQTVNAATGGGGFSAPDLSGFKAKLPDGQAPEHIMQFFAFEHLPPHLRAVSEPFAVLAAHVVATLPRNPERTVALRKLLESKDASVRACIAK